MSRKLEGAQGSFLVHVGSFGALISTFLQQKELMEAGRKQLEQLVQMNFLQQAHLGQPEVGKALLEQLQSSQDSFSHSHLRNVSIAITSLLSLLKNSIQHRPDTIQAPNTRYSRYWVIERYDCRLYTIQAQNYGNETGLIRYRVCRFISAMSFLLSAF